jgi:putative addiction module killer protein
VRLAIRELMQSDGRCPFREWLERLDIKVRARIQARVLRFETGNLGDYKALGGGVFEARLVFGPGYRICFSRIEQSMILLPLGREKASQAQDIREARRYWREYLEATRHGQAQ